jgi:hypothetical protein
MVNREIWRKIDCPERVAASVTGHQSMRLFVWGYLKQRVYNPLAKTLEDLRSNLTKEIENIPTHFFEFPKKVHIFDYRWWRSY